MYTVRGILTFIQRLISVWLQSLHHRFVTGTKPDTTSLLLGTLTSLTRSKSKLVSENAILRKPFIILRGEVKQPACTKTDGMILGLLPKAIRTWKQSLFLLMEDAVYPLVASENDSSALLPLQNCCCTAVIIQKSQDPCSLT
jgi:hypothetical protein